MIESIEGILIGSSNAQKLADFYENVVGLKLAQEMEIGEKGEKAFAFQISNGPGLVIMDHSEVKGTNSQGGRMMFNLEVDNIEEEVEKLKNRGAKIVQDIYHIQDYGLVATIADSEGNYFQFVKTKP